MAVSGPQTKSPAVPSHLNSPAVTTMKRVLISRLASPELDLFCDPGRSCGLRRRDQDKVTRPVQRPFYRRPQLVGGNERRIITEDSHGPPPPPRISERLENSLQSSGYRLIVPMLVGDESVVSCP